MYTYYYDYLSRNSVDDFFINNYYYFWTSFWYIPTLMALFFVFYIYTSDFTLIFIYKLSISLLVILWYEILDYWLMSVKEYELLICSDNINPLLLNSINKYHPLIFYYSTLLSIVFSSITLCINFSTCNRPFLTKNLIYKLPDYVIFNFLSINFTLFLGSWWALQEGSWGGWWNWDPSEVFGMVIMVFTVINIHYISKGSFNNTYRYSFLVYFTLSILLYIFIQLNFNLVSHNFGIKSSQFVNTIQFFFLVFLFIILRILLVIKTFNYSLKNFILYVDTRLTRTFSLGHKLTRYLFYLTSLVLTIVLSFYPLINDFLWKVNCISILNIPINFPNLIILIIIYTYSVFFTSTTYYLLLLIYSITLGPQYMLMLTVIYSFKASNIIHNNILIILILNFINYNKVLVNWYFGLKNNYVDSLYSIKYFYNLTPSIFNNTLDFCILFSDDFNSYSSSVVTYTESTSPDNNPLYLLSTGPYLVQLLIGGMFYNIFYINVTDSSVQLVYILWFSTTIFILFFFRRKILIIS